MRALVLSAAVVAACSGHSEVAKVADLSADQTVADLAADDHGLAWLESGKNLVRLKTLTGKGEPRVVADGFLFHVALEGDALYWADGDHVWRSPREKRAPAQIAELDDVPTSLLVAGGYVYWATSARVGRIPLGGGASQIVVARPPADGFAIERIAVDGPRIVAALDRERRTEIWQLDGEPRRIAAYPGYAVQLLLDGTTILLQRTTKTGGDVVATDLSGAQRAPPISGDLVAARDGVVYVGQLRPEQATFAIGQDGVAHRVGPRCLKGVLVGDRLYGVFQDAKLRESIGSVAIRAR